MYVHPSQTEMGWDEMVPFGHPGKTRWYQLPPPTSAKMAWNHLTMVPVVLHLYWIFFSYRLKKFNYTYRSINKILYSFIASGTWYVILTLLNYAGVVTNGFLIAFTSSWGAKYDTAGKLWIVIGFEVSTKTWCLLDVYIE